jgi:hypothetical protein
LAARQYASIRSISTPASAVPATVSMDAAAMVNFLRDRQMALRGGIGSGRHQAPERRHRPGARRGIRHPTGRA